MGDKRCHNRQRNDSVKERNSQSIRERERESSLVYKYLLYFTNFSFQGKEKHFPASAFPYPALFSLIIDTEEGDLIFMCQPHTWGALVLASLFFLSFRPKSSQPPYYMTFYLNPVVRWILSVYTSALLYKYFLI